MVDFIVRIGREVDYWMMHEISVAPRELQGMTGWDEYKNQRIDTLCTSTRT